MDSVEAAALLTLASLRDNRKVTEETAMAWAEDLADISFDDAKAALSRHFGYSTDYLMAGHIRECVREIRAERTAAARRVDEIALPAYLEAMEDGPEFDAAYLAWIKSEDYHPIPRQQLVS